jgi:solute carrier family 15 oligopeptide transporter 1
LSGVLEAKEKMALSWAITKNGLGAAFKDKIEKSKSGDPMVRALISMESGSVDHRILKLHSRNENYELEISQKLNFTEFIEIDHNNFKISIDGVTIDDMSFVVGGVYTIVGHISDEETILKKVTVADPNIVHILWLLPQYVVMTMGEIMFSITGLEFAFTQAPSSMKSLLQASFLLTVAFGNLIVVIIAEAHFFKRQVRMIVTLNRFNSSLISFTFTSFVIQLHSYIASLL